MCSGDSGLYVVVICSGGSGDSCLSVVVVVVYV